MGQNTASPSAVETSSKSPSQLSSPTVVVPSSGADETDSENERDEDEQGDGDTTKEEEEEEDEEEGNGGETTAKSK